MSWQYQRFRTTFASIKSSYHHNSFYRPFYHILFYSRSDQISSLHSSMRVGRILVAITALLSAHVRGQEDEVGSFMWPYANDHRIVRNTYIPLQDLIYNTCKILTMALCPLSLHTKREIQVLSLSMEPASTVMLQWLMASLRVVMSLEATAALQTRAKKVTESQRCHTVSISQIAFSQWKTKPSLTPARRRSASSGALPFALSLAGLTLSLSQIKVSFALSTVLAAVAGGAA